MLKIKKMKTLQLQKRKRIKDALLKIETQNRLQNNDFKFREICMITLERNYLLFHL